MYMHKLTQADYTLLTRLFQYSENDLLAMMNGLLKRYYNKVYYQKGKYLFAVSDESKIGVVAHCDTVFYTQPKVEGIYYDPRKNVMWSPDGLGADDRAGVFLILKLLQSKIRPNIILTQGEESGGIGAQELIKVFPKNDFDLKFLIQLDRRNSNDCVFYSCSNIEFTKKIESYGFVEKSGSFTDISFIAPAWGIAATNLSVGYVNEHTKQEHLYITDMMNTLNKVKRIFKDEETLPKYEYIEAKWEKGYGRSYAYGYDIGWQQEKCPDCKADVDANYDGIPVYSKEGVLEYYCPECFSKICGTLNWCSCCGMPYLTDDKPTNVCPQCVKEGLV